MSEQDIAGLRVLAVDDEKFMLQLVTRVLGELGITDVETAEDGHQAMEILSKPETLFDLMICDLSMPVMGGLELISALREMDDSAVNQLPVIVLTGHPERELVLQAGKLGISGFIVKPVSLHLLETRIRAAMTRDPAASRRAVE